MFSKERYNYHPYPQSIRWKIFFFLLIFCALLLLILWLSQVVFLDRFYRSIKIREVKESGQLLEQHINSEDLPQLIAHIGGEKDLGVEIGDDSGGVIYAQDFQRMGVFRGFSKEERKDLMEKAKKNGGEYLEFQTNIPMMGNEKRWGIHNSDRHLGSTIVKDKAIRSSFIGESLVYARILEGETGNKEGILIYTLISPVSATVGTLRIQLQYITGLMILFSVFVAFLLSRRISVPLERLNQSAKNLARGDYGTRFEARGFREVEELSQTLDYAAKELSQVENLRRELMANVSHDLRTPLTLISGYAQAMQELPGELSPENAAIIASEAQRLTLLVNDMLKVSALQNAAVPLNKKPYALTQSLQKLKTSIEELAKKEGYHIDFIYDKKIVINADETQITGAVYNLISNALYHGSKDNKVVLRQKLIYKKIPQIKDQTLDFNQFYCAINDNQDKKRGKAQGVLICVEDKGKGIEKKDLPHIWERYYTTREMKKTPIAGTGLGLSIVRSVAKQHDGRCGVISQKGEGSIFWIELPL